MITNITAHVQPPGSAPGMAATPPGVLRQVASSVSPPIHGLPCLCRRACLSPGVCAARGPVEPSLGSGTCTDVSSHNSCRAAAGWFCAVLCTRKTPGVLLEPGIAPWLIGRRAPVPQGSPHTPRSQLAQPWDQPQSGCSWLQGSWDPFSPSSLHCSWSLCSGKQKMWCCFRLPQHRYWAQSGPASAHSQMHRGAGRPGVG